MNNPATPGPSPFRKPDPETLERIKLLAKVGNALYQTESEASFETNFFLAKEALIKFKNEFEELDLDIEYREGMRNLIKYLQGKIDKRLKKVSDESIWMQ